jgi:hypothetical protein
MLSCLSESISQVSFSIEKTISYFDEHASRPFDEKADSPPFNDDGAAFVFFTLHFDEFFPLWLIALVSGRTP